MSESNMGTGDVLGAAGATLTVTYKDRQHPVSRPTARVLDRVEMLVAQNQNAATNEMAGILPAKDAAAMKADLMTKLRAREHATGGTLWAAEMEADGGMRGLQMVFWSCLEDARERSADKAGLPPPIKIEEIPAVLAESPDAEMVARLLLPDFFQAAQRRRGVPAAKKSESPQA